MLIPRHESLTIQRSFIDLAEIHDDGSGIESPFLFGLGHDLSDWDELLESPRVLLVSEAGSGKSFECKGKQQELWDKGEPAFYLDLSDLARTSFNDLLFPDQKHRLEAWRASQSEEATFFLDSIDELNLTSVVGRFSWSSVFGWLE